MLNRGKFKKEIEKIEESIEGLETDMTTQNYKLSSAISNGDKTGEMFAESNINTIKQEKTKRVLEKKIREEKIKIIEKQNARKKKN